MFSQYYDILGISSDSTLNEIKAAFREKAKKFHPDLNSSPDANDKFIAINEAYTFLLRLSTSFASSQTYNRPNPDEFYNDWLKTERLKARKRAAERAKMKFEEYKKSAIYKTTSTLNHILDIFGIFLGAFIIIASAFGLYTQGLYVIENEVEVLNLKGIFLDAALTLAGIAFISLSLASIKKRIRMNRSF